MGEARKDALRLDFERRLKLEFHGTKITSNAGLLAYRELDEALGLTSKINSGLRDTRTGKNTQHGLVRKPPPDSRYSEDAVTASLSLYPIRMHLASIVTLPRTSNGSLYSRQCLSAANR